MAFGKNGIYIGTIDRDYCTTHSKLVRKPMEGEYAADHTIAQEWCSNKFALHILWIYAILLHAKIIFWMKYALHVDALWLYLVRRKKKKELRLIQGTRGVVQHK